jgi:DtxR family Mn-dependent transcriptional regulator
MSALRRVGALPGAMVVVTAAPAGVRLARGGETAELDFETASHLFVSVG